MEIVKHYTVTIKCENTRCLLELTNSDRNNVTGKNTKQCKGKSFPNLPEIK